MVVKRKTAPSWSGRPRPPVLSRVLRQQAGPAHIASQICLRERGDEGHAVVTTDMDMSGFDNLPWS